LGIGLAIAKEIVELHGGTIRAMSAGIGQGAEFVATLPLPVLKRSPEARRVHPTAPSSIPIEPGLTELSGLKILFVDDEPDARGLVKRLLEECGAEVVTAEGATQALELVTHYSPNLVISDVGMPEVDGYEFLRRLRRSEHVSATVPAIAPRRLHPSCRQTHRALGTPGDNRRRLGTSASR
jgi:hypothetical protein